jgi:hypothetical protein
MASSIQQLAGVRVGNDADGYERFFRRKAADHFETTDSRLEREK